MVDGHVLHGHFQRRRSASSASVGGGVLLGEREAALGRHGVVSGVGGAGSAAVGGATGRVSRRTHLALERICVVTKEVGTAVEGHLAVDGGRVGAEVCGADGGVVAKRQFVELAMQKVGCKSEQQPQFTRGHVAWQLGQVHLSRGRGSRVLLLLMLLVALVLRRDVLLLLYLMRALGVLLAAVLRAGVVLMLMLMLMLMLLALVEEGAMLRLALKCK